MRRSSTARRRYPPSSAPMRRHENEPFVVNREVRAVIVPAGQEVKLRPGQAGYITQALGGSFTVYLEGNLFRIAGEDADAIGQETVKPPELPPNANEEDVRKLAWEQMRACFDPEIPINIVDLGLVYACDVTQNEDGTRTVEVTITLTAPGCGMARFWWTTCATRSSGSRRYARRACRSPSIPPGTRA